MWEFTQQLYRTGSTPASSLAQARRRYSEGNVSLTKPESPSGIAENICLDTLDRTSQANALQISISKLWRFPAMRDGKRVNI